MKKYITYVLLVVVIGSLGLLYIVYDSNKRKSELELLKLYRLQDSNSKSNDYLFTLNERISTEISTSGNTAKVEEVLNIHNEAIELIKFIRMVKELLSVNLKQTKVQRFRFKELDRSDYVSQLLINEHEGKLNGMAYSLAHKIEKYKTSLGKYYKGDKLVRLGLEDPRNEELFKRMELSDGVLNSDAEHFYFENASIVMSLNFLNEIELSVLLLDNELLKKRNNRVSSLEVDDFKIKSSVE